MLEVLKYNLNEINYDPYHGPGYSPTEVPRKFVEVWGQTTLYTVNSWIKKVLQDFFGAKHGNLRNIEHGFHGTACHIPMEMLDHDIDNVVAKQCMSTVRATWTYVKTERTLFKTSTNG
jgi:hypothetical protein